MEKEKQDYQIGAIYLIQSRNLRIGVCVDGELFLGIREKFGSRFIDGEGNGSGYIHVLDPTPLGHVPEGMSLEERGPTLCKHCRKSIRYVWPSDSPTPWQCDGDCEDPFAVSTPNQALHDLLESYEEKYPREVR